ncbi:hypothetical protein KC322_g122 [Hortaea werneckii]|nr:hypothetical protein KC322_g122 [Hortaea werneckii]
MTRMDDHTICFQSYSTSLCKGGSVICKAPPQPCAVPLYVPISWPDSSETNPAGWYRDRGTMFRLTVLVRLVRLPCANSDLGTCE